MKFTILAKLAVVASVLSLSVIATSLDDKVSLISKLDIHDKASTSSFGSNRSRANGNGLEQREKCSEWVSDAADKAGSKVCGKN